MSKLKTTQEGKIAVNETTSGQIQTIRNIITSVILCVTLQVVFAEDTLETVLGRLKPEQASQFSYLETRELQLLQAPWQGSGDIYISPLEMLIVQHLPSELTLLVTRDKFHYIDPDQNIHRIKRLSSPFLVPQIGVFVNLVLAEHSLESLDEKYRIKFSNNPSGWKINLSPGQESSFASMQISGLDGSGPNKLVLTSRDGDKTTWEMTLAGQGMKIEQKMDEIINMAMEKPASANPGINNTSKSK